jgi:hypothetical protein
MSINIPKNFQKAGCIHMHQAKVGGEQLAVGSRQKNS